MNSEFEKSCDSCKRTLRNKLSFQLAHGKTWKTKCMRCSLIDKTLVIRSLKVSLIVGTILIGLNQGDKLINGTFPWSASWFKIPLTYAVPFCVATYGALANGYKPESQND